MKIDLVLTACDMNDHYLSLYPHVHRTWKHKFNLDCYLVLIANSVPDFLETYRDYIILFPPIEGIHTAFIAQVIRILYPCLFDNKNVLITDADIFPLSNHYFIKSIDDKPDNAFISYRDAYLKMKMLAICYNVASSTTWREIFGINNIDQVTATIKQWYTKYYTGTKNCIGWFTDQQKLYTNVMKWSENNKQRFYLLNDVKMGFKRLDKRKKVYIVENATKVIADLRKNIYTDFHMIKPYSKYRKLIEMYVDAACS